ncbi:hypothetical protein F52700_2313 [Fusarium sp. NRRL 52700]|nr:hypothetical protein F52700_2313 [Fusarium sp. NRRL 52700]
MAKVAGFALGALGVVGLIGAFKDTINLFSLLVDSHDLGQDSNLRNKYGLDEANDQEGTTALVSVSSFSVWRMDVFKTQYDGFKKRISQGNDKPFHSRSVRPERA